MLRYVSRTLVAAAVAATTTACAAGMGGAGASIDRESGGRYRVLVPTLGVGAGVPAGTGESVAEDLRALISGMATHTAVSEGAMRSAASEYGIEQLDSATAVQLAEEAGVQLSLWGTIESTGAGLESDVVVVDAPSGESLVLEDVTGPDAGALAQAIFQEFQQQIQGLRTAGFCNDYLSSQQFERALENCEEALALAPRSTAALYGKATALYNLDRVEEALATYEQLLEIDPTHGDALLGAGIAAGQLGQTEEASAYLTTYMEQNPGDLTVRMRVAGDIAQAGDYQAAYAVLEPANTPENEGNIDFQQYLAQVATAAGQTVTERGDSAAAAPYFQTALGAYETVFAARPDSLDASVYRQAIAVNRELGRTNEALQLAEVATQQFAEDAGIWSVYATVLSDAGRGAEAAQALESAIEIDPELENGHIRLALLQMEAGNRQAALQSLERAAAGGNQANVARAIYSMGADALRAGQWAEAENLFEMAHGYASDDIRSDISFYWGLALYRQGEEVAQANAQTGSAAEARRALELFQQAASRLQASNNAQAAEVLGAAQEYIANQEAIIAASGG